MLQRRASDQKEAVLSAGVFEANLFGPQSRWSSLLGQREHLENEIERGKKYLARLEKDLADWEALVQNWPARPVAVRNGKGNGKRRVAPNSTMVQFLGGWLRHLQTRLNAVTEEIKALEKQNGIEAQPPEESMFALLRAAG